MYIYIEVRQVYKDVVNVQSQNIGETQVCEQAASSVMKFIGHRPLTIQSQHMSFEAPTTPAWKLKQT